jgi:hypothetical protein
MRSTRLGIFGSLGMCVVVLPACTSNGHMSPGRSLVPPAASSATPRGGSDLRTVVDSAPYWCDLVSKEALRRVAGLYTSLGEVRNPEATKNHTVCGVKDNQLYGPLNVWWDVAGGRVEVASLLKKVSADQPRRVVPDYGFGFAVYSPGSLKLPYLTAAVFRCGANEPWIYIAVREISPGRKAIEDLTGLMRVAQRRFGQLHRCTPKPL